MAQLALGVVGAVAGSFFGMPQIGFMIGSAIGGVLFADKGSNSEGPKLSDLSSTTCQYGTYIGIVYGTVRRSGNVFWSTKKKEHKKTVGGGKGASGGSSTTYTYTQSFALGLSESEILGIKKIWFNNTLVYESSSTSSMGTVISSSNVKSKFKVYNGTEEQLPDPTIQSYEGIENTPAFRSVAYIVFSDLDITNYGSIPNILVEVVGKNGGVETFGKILQEHSDNYFTDSLGDISPSLRSLYLANYPTYSITNGYPVNIGSFPSVRNISNDIAQIINHKLYYRDNFINNMYTNKTFYLNFNQNIAYDLRDKKDIEVFNNPPVFIEDRTDRENYCLIPMGKLSNNNFIYYQTQNLLNPISSSMNEKTSPLVSLTYFSTDQDNEFTRRSIASKITNGRYIVGANMSYDNNEVMILTSESSLLQNSNTGVVYYDKFSRSADNINITESGIFENAVTAFGFNEAFVGKRKFAFEGNNIYKIDGFDNTHVRVTLYEIDNYIVKYRNSIIIKGVFEKLSFAATNQLLYIIDSDAHSSVLTSSSYIDNRTLSLADVVKDQFSYVGITEDRLDLSELVSDQVYGYLINNRSSARANIEKLCNIYFFDICESDGKLKARKRGQDNSGSIIAEDLSVFEGSLDNDTEYDLRIEHLDELNLPQRTEVSYWSYDEGLEVRTQYEQRQQGYAIDVSSYELPIVITNDMAKKSSSILLYNAWLERNKFNWTTSYKYVQYEPGDVVRITNFRGNTYNIRITKKDVGANGVIDWEGAEESQSVYTQTQKGVDSLVPETSIKYVETTRLIPMNLPIINDIQPDTNSYFIAAAPFGDTGQWNGAQTLKTIDNDTYVFLNDGVFDQEDDTVFGNCLNTLSNYNEDNTLDISSSLSVLLNTDNEEISSYTLNDLISRNLNYALVGNEIVQFMNVKQTGNKTYKLTNFLRGRAGTEHYINSHQSGETFVLLDLNKIRIISDSISNINVEYGLRGLSNGLNNLSNSIQVQFTQDGSPIKPLAPADFRAIRQPSNLYNFFWTRRARVNANWNNNIDVPLDESNEQYIIEIYNSTYTTLLNSYTVNNATTFAYTTNMQTADYGNSVNKVYVIIYQISSRAGKGWGSKIENIN